MREPLSGFNGPDVLKPWAETAAHLQDKRVAVVWIIALQPQHARIHVRHERPAAEDVGSKPAMRTLSHAAITTICGKPASSNPISA